MVCSALCVCGTLKIESTLGGRYGSFVQLMEVFAILHGLPRVDKFRAVQFLASELAQEEAGTLLPNGDYAIWSPHDATEAANTLMQFLDAQKKSA